MSCSYQPVVDYIDKQFESYLQEELKIKRSLHNYHDSRVHACLYFISPSGHSLKSLDLVTMKKLDSKVGTETGMVWFQILTVWSLSRCLVTFSFFRCHFQKGCGAAHHSCVCEFSFVTLFKSGKCSISSISAEYKIPALKNASIHIRDETRTLQLPGQNLLPCQF